MNKELLNNLLQALQSINWDVKSLLTQPISEPQNIRNLLSSAYTVEIGEISNLITFYQFSNGMSFVEGDYHKSYIAPDVYFNSIDGALMILKEDNFFNFRDNMLFPIFQSLKGEYLAVKIDGNSPLLYYCSTFDYEIDSIVSMYDSLESFITTTIKFIEMGYIVVDDEGDLSLEILDYDLYLKTGQKCNPESDYWKQKILFESRV